MMSVDLSQSLDGRTISHYRILTKLSSEGAQGVVFKAEDTRIRDRIVALKFLSPSLHQNPDAFKLIRREAEAIARFDHPNIVTLYEFDEVDGVPFFSMQYIDGGNLKERLREGLLPAEEIIQIGIEVASALRYAHDRGVVHCDIKPANIMMTADGKVKLTDFGIAEIAQRTMIGQDGMLKGTLAYMPPEIIQGKKPNRLCDIYSLGVVLYELITGMQPFQGASITQLFHAITHQKERPIRELQPEAPERLESIIAKMMAKDPEDRYQNASDLEWDLHRNAAPIERTAVSVKTLGLPGETPTTRHPELTGEEKAAPAALWNQVRGSAAAGLWNRLGSRAKLLLTTGLVLLLFSALFPLLYPHLPDMFLLKERDIISTIPKVPSIAVLPFRSVGKTEAEEAFALGITEDLITDLSNIKGIRVAPILAVLPYRELTVNFNEIMKHLHSRFVLNGSVRRADSRVRVTAQLVDVTTKENIWAERLDHEVHLDDFFAIQDDITRRIIAALEMKVTAREEKQITKQHTITMKAYDYYALGREYYWRRSKESNGRAIEMFQKAIQIDPDYALAYAGLSNCYHHLYDNGWDPDPKWIDKAIELSEKATSIDSDLPEAYHAKALAMIAKKDYVGATQFDKMALALRSNYFSAYHTLGISMLRLNRYAEAREALEKCLELYPSYDPATRDIGRSYEYQEAYHAAVPYFEKAFETKPIFLNMIYLGRIYTKTGRKDEGEALLTQAIEKYPDEFWPYDFLARFYMARMRFDEAETLYEQVLEMAPRVPSALNNAAFFYNLAGEYQVARALLDRSLEMDANNPSAQFRLCSNYYLSGEIERALELSKALMERFPHDLCPYYIQAQLLLLEGRIDEADDISVKMMSVFREDPVSADLGGRILLFQDKVKEAEQLGREMTTQFPESPRGYNLLAAALLQQGRTDEAAQAQALAIRTAPDEPETIYNTVKGFEASGRTDELHYWKEQLAELSLEKIIPHAPIGDRENNLFWLKENMAYYP